MGGNMSDNIQAQIKKDVESNPVVVYMKGTLDAPGCGFSATVAQILQSYKVPIKAVDVLENPGVRDGIKRFTNWPTIPQVFINGKFIGGCDIVFEMHDRGELEPLLKEAVK